MLKRKSKALREKSGKAISKNRKRRLPVKSGNSKKNLTMQKSVPMPRRGQKKLRKKLRTEEE